jgi:hypothetical protein
VDISTARRRTPLPLCARRERPRRRAAEEQPHEIAPSELIELHPIPSTKTVARRPD